MEKKKEKNDTLSIRINYQILADFDKKLSAIYNKQDHRKKSKTLAKLIKEFNRQDTDKLRTCLYNDIAIVNADIINIHQQLQTSKDNYNELQQKTMQQQDKYNKQIKEKDKQITTLTSENNNIKSMLDDAAKNHQNNMSIKDTIIAEKDKTITSLTAELQQNKKDTSNAIQDAKDDKNKIIETLKQTIKEKDKTITLLQNTLSDLKTDKKSFAEKNDLLAADNKRLNGLLYVSENNNKKLSNNLVAAKNNLTAVKNLSLLHRLFKVYPDDEIFILDDDDVDDILTISDADTDADKNNDTTS